MESQFVICRGCLTTCPRYQATLLCGEVKLPNSPSTTYQNIIAVIAGVNAAATDMICMDCRKKSLEAYEFRQKVRQTDKQLKHSDTKYEEDNTEDSFDNTEVFEVDTVQTSPKQNQCLVCSKYFKSSVDLVVHIRENHPKVMSKKLRKKTDTKLGVKKENTNTTYAVQSTTRKSQGLKECRIPIVNATPEEKIETRKLKNSDGKSVYLPKKLVSKGTMLKLKKKQAVKVKMENNIRCGICSRLFEKGPVLDDHCREHGGTEIIECALCFRIYLKYPYFKSHFNKHHPEMTNITGAENTETVLEIAPDGVEILQYVNMTTIADVISRLVLPENDQTEPREIEAYVQVCGLCGAILLSPEQLQEHNINEHEDFDRRCYICAEELEKPVMAKAHILECKLKEFLHDCHICLKKLKNERSLVEHIKTVHSSSFKAWLQARDTIRNYECGLCSKRFPFLRHLNRHVAECVERQENAEYTCDVCQKVFKSKLYLKRHIQHNHTVENKKIHLCSLCGFTFTSRACLNRHTTTHTKEYRHVCEECNKGFATKHAYNYHMNRHTGDSPYVCEWSDCHKRFARPYSLRLHMRTHTGEKPIMCQYCNEGFRHGDALRKHIKTVHDNDITIHTYLPA